MLTPHLSPEMLTQIPKTDLPTLMVTQLKYMGAPVSGTSGLLATCLFSEVTSPTLLIRSCMYCGLRKHYPYVNEQVLERVCVKVGNTSKTSMA